MEIKYNGKNYIYNPETNSITTTKGSKPRKEEEILKHLHKLLEVVKSKGYNYAMPMEQFEFYLAALNGDEKEELFHCIYDNYLCVGEFMNTKGVSNGDFMKCMSKLKKYEQFLYQIIK